MSLKADDFAFTLSGKKKVGEKWISFSQMTTTFSRLNFNRILFNPTRNFPVFFKSRRRTFDDFSKTLPNSLTQSHLLPSNFKVHWGKTFLRKIFSRICRPKIAEFAEDIFEFIWISKFVFIWIAKLSSVKLTLYQGPKITVLVSKYSLWCWFRYIFSWTVWL